MTRSRLLSTAVGDFYERVLADADLAPWFAGVDLARLRRHQTDFLFAVMGVGADGRASDADLGARLRTAHAGLDIDQSTYDRTVQHLTAALAGIDLSAAELDEVLRRVRSLRDYVVGA